MGRSTLPNQIVVPVAPAVAIGVRRTGLPKAIAPYREVFWPNASVAVEIGGRGGACI